MSKKTKSNQAEETCTCRVLGEPTALAWNTPWRGRRARANAMARRNNQDFSQEAYLAGLSEQREAKERAKAEDRLRDRAANLAHMANDGMAGGRGGPQLDPFLREQGARLNQDARQAGIQIGGDEPVASSAQAAMQQAAPSGAAQIVPGGGGRDFSSLLAPAPPVRAPAAPPPPDMSEMSERDRAWEQKRLARLAKQQGGAAPAQPAAATGGAMGGVSARDA
eukprot:6357999-Prymnesium_polylepis.1